MSELATKDQITDITVNGSMILEKNIARADKAVAVGQNILSSIEASGMTPELDERANKFLVNARTAKNEMEVERKPITSFFDSIRKQFTEAEGKLDITKSDTVAAKIQAHRNKYVQQLKAAEEARQAEMQKKINHDNELIELKASAETLLSQYVQAHIFSRKQNLLAGFNAITLENYAEKSKNLKGLKPEYKREHFDAFSPILTRKHTTEEEANNVVSELLKAQDFSLIAAVVSDELMKYKNELVEKLGSLKNSLEEQASADEAEKARLAKEKLDRERKEAEELEKKNAEELAKAQDKINQQKTAEQTEALMENLSVSHNTSIPQTRSGFNIIVNNPAGIIEIVNFWFQREGHAMSVPDLEKKTIAQMKTFCQNYAHKHDEKIVSKNLTYEPVHKAVNRK